MPRPKPTPPKVRTRKAEAEIEDEHTRSAPRAGDLQAEVEAFGGVLVDHSTVARVVLVALPPEGTLWGGELEAIRATWWIDAPPEERAEAIAAAVARIRSLPPV